MSSRSVWIKVAPHSQLLSVIQGGGDPTISEINLNHHTTPLCGKAHPPPTPIYKKPQAEPGSWREGEQLGVRGRIRRKTPPPSKLRSN